MLKAGDNY